MNHVCFREYAEAAQKFLENEWFYRVWTFQEAFLARDIDVVCGKTIFPWKPFVMSWGALDRIGIKLPLKGIESAKTLFATCSWDWFENEPLLESQAKPSGLRLSNLMRSTYTHKASNDKDHIFGLLAMVDPRDGITFTSHDGPIEEVYTQYAKLMIQDDGLLQILSDAQNRDSGILLPSWVPDVS